MAGADSRHTVNVAYLVRRTDPDAAVELDDQHDDYRFVSPADSDARDARGDLHEYVRLYLDDLERDA